MHDDNASPVLIVGDEVVARMRLEIDVDLTHTLKNILINDFSFANYGLFHADLPFFLNSVACKHVVAAVAP